MLPVVGVAVDVDPGAVMVFVVGAEDDVELRVGVLLVLTVLLDRVLVANVEVGGTYVGEALAPPWPRLFLMLSN